MYVRLTDVERGIPRTVNMLHVMSYAEGMTGPRETYLRMSDGSILRVEETPEQIDELLPLMGGSLDHIPSVEDLE